MTLFVLFTLSCQDDDTPQSVVRSYTDIEEDFQAFEFKAGTQDLTLKINDDLDYHFRVIVPDVDLTQDLPLMLALHFAVDNDPDIHKETSCYIEPGLEELDAIILSPNGGETVWGTLDNQDKLRILIDLSSRFWPVDAARIGLMGFSSGGNGTWLYAESQPQVFSAGIAIASGYNTLRPDGSAREIETPLYVIHGEEDDFFPIDTVQMWVDETNAAGSEVEFVRIPGLGHYQPCDYVPHIKDAVTWLKNDIWDF